MKVGIAGVIAMVLGVTAPAPADVNAAREAAAPTQRTTTTLTAGPATFERGGETFRLTLTASDDGNDDTITMTLRRTRDPDGDGVARSRQAHERSFEVPDSMTTQPGLGHAAVVTDEKLAPYGEISVEFTPTAAAEPAPCYAASRTVRNGRINGTVRFVSGTGFDDVVVTSMRARLDSVEGGPCLPPHAPPPSCQRAGRLLWAEDGDLRMSAFATSRSLVLHHRRENVLPLRHSDAGVYVVETAVTRLPLDHARVAADLSSATVRGMRGTDVRRRGIFSASSPIRRDVFACDDQTGEIVERRRRGTVTGTMGFAFFIGANEHLADRALRGSLTHWRKRPLE